MAVGERHDTRKKMQNQMRSKIFKEPKRSTEALWGVIPCSKTTVLQQLAGGIYYPPPDQEISEAIKIKASTREGAGVGGISTIPILARYTSPQDRMHREHFFLPSRTASWSDRSWTPQGKEH